MEMKIGTLFIAWAVILVMYTLFKIFKKRDNDFDAEMHKIMTSDEHKVKGQYTK